MLRFLAGYCEEIALAAFLAFLVPILVLVNRPAGGKSRYWRPLSYVLIAVSIASVVAFCAVICIGRSEEGRWAVLDANTPIADYVDFLRDFPDSEHLANAESAIRKGQTEIVRLFEETGENHTGAVLCGALQAQGPLPTLEIRILYSRGALSYVHRAREQYEMVLDDFEDKATTIFKEAAALFAPTIVETRINAQPWVTPAAHSLVTVELSYQVKNASEYAIKGWDSGPVSYTFSGIGMTTSWAIYVPGEEAPRLKGDIADCWPPASPHWGDGKSPEAGVAGIVTKEVLAGLRRAFAPETPQADGEAGN